MEEPKRHQRDSVVIKKTIESNINKLFEETLKNAKGLWIEQPVLSSMMGRLVDTRKVVSKIARFFAETGKDERICIITHQMDFYRDAFESYESPNPFHFSFGNNNRIDLHYSNSKNSLRGCDFTICMFDDYIGTEKCMLNVKMIADAFYHVKFVLMFINSMTAKPDSPPYVMNLQNEETKQ